MTHSSAPNTPNIPPPPEPPTNDPSRNRDEWVAVLVALLAMGGIFFWATDTDRPNGLSLGRRSSSSTQVEDLPGLSQLLQDPDLLDTSIPSPRFDQDQVESGSSSLLLSPNSSSARRRAWQSWRLRTLLSNREAVQTVPEEATTEEELLVPVEGETPLEATDTETPVETEASETAPEVTEEETTEEGVVVPTDEAETPEAEAEQSQDTEESEEATAQQSQRPRFGIPFFGNNSEETETPTATEEEPTEAAAVPDEEETAEQPEGEPDSTEAATAPDEEEQAAEQTEGEPDSTEAATAPDEEEQAAEQAEAEEEPTEATATAPDEEETTAEESEAEQATAAKPDKPSLGFSIPGFGRKKDEPAASSAEFSDVPDDFWAKDYVQYFVQQDIITGYEDGTFKPEEPMSRAAVAAQIEDSFGFAETERDQALSFEDVGQEYWAESAIDGTTKTGFLSGYPGDVFRPEKPMTRTEVLVAIVSGLNLKPSGDPEEILSIYQDADQIPEWAVEKVAAATEAGLVVSYPNTDTFNPNEPASRAEVSAMLYQALVEAGKVDPMSSEYIINPKK